MHSRSSRYQTDTLQAQSRRGLAEELQSDSSLSGRRSSSFRQRHSEADNPTREGAGTDSSILTRQEEDNNNNKHQQGLGSVPQEHIKLEATTTAFRKLRASIEQLPKLRTAPVTTEEVHLANQHLSSGSLSPVGSATSPPPLTAAGTSSPQSTPPSSSRQELQLDQQDLRSPPLLRSSSSDPVRRETSHSSSSDIAMASASTSTETRRPGGSSSTLSHQHTRNPSNGSNKSDKEKDSLFAAASTSSRRSSSRKSATPSAINTLIANASAASNPNASSSSSSTPTSAFSKQNTTNLKSAILSGLLSPDSASNLTSAQQSALEKALAAGISRDEFEKTRASVVSMLRGAGVATTESASAPNSADSSMANTVLEDLATLPADDAELSLAPSIAEIPSKLSISTSGGISSSKRASARDSLSRRGLDSASTSQTGISELGTSTAPSTAASTLRTSVSSSATDDIASQHAQESPVTSEDGEKETAKVATSPNLNTKRDGKQRSARQRTPPAMHQEDREDVTMLTSTTGIDEEEDDSSFNAATAAAAALGMLASSPVKVIERRPSYNNASATTTTTSTQQHAPFMHGASGMFSQHRQPSSNSLGLPSSSSPPLQRGAGGVNARAGLGANDMARGQGLSPAAGIYSTSPSGSHSPFALNAELPSSSSGELRPRASSAGKTTTPVRTRLEDIALKSSAQIRRQRHLLGLGEEEMMDLDTDARHENALLRGARFGDGEGEEDDETLEFVEDEDEDEDEEVEQGVIERSLRPQPRQQPRRHPEEQNDDMYAGRSSLAPAFSYPQTSPSASVSRRASRSPSRNSSAAAIDSRAPPHPRHAGHYTPAQEPISASSRQQPSSQASTSASGSRRRAHHHHRRVSSFGMSGMMDRFMESAYSPKAAQIAKFEEAVRRASPEREQNRTGAAGYPSTSSYDTDRTLTHTRRGDEEDGEEDEDFYYEEFEDDVDGEHERTAHSTPKLQMDKSRLLRSAGNDLPSPLLQQIRMLSDADQSPRMTAERPTRGERETPRYARGAHGYSARQELGLTSGHGSSSEFGSARKRKASYDLQSPRHLVRGLHTSPTPEEDDHDQGGGQRQSRVLSPPPFPSYAHSDPRFIERHATSDPSSSGLFEGPTPSHSQTSSQSSVRSYGLPQSQTSSQPRPRSQGRSTPSHPAYQSQPHPRDAYQYEQPPPQVYHQNHPPSSAERQNPAYYQQYPRPYPNDEELSHYALAPPRPPSHGHAHVNPHSQHMNRPESMGSDYIPNQRDLKKREKAAKKNQQGQQMERHGSHPSSTASGPAGGQSSGDPVSTLDNFMPATVQVGQYDEKTKPPFSYAALIGQAIFSTPNRRMSLADIYTYIMTLYPFYKKQDAGWQNSIRHNLSLNECFVKTQRAPDEPGKGCLWSIFPGTEEQFTGGNFYKKGKVPKSALRNGGGSSAGPSSTDGNADGQRKKANSVASGTDAASVMSADESFDSQSVNSSSFISNSSSTMQSGPYGHSGRPLPPHYGHPLHAPHNYQGAAHGYQPHAPSSLGQQKQQAQYSDELESEVYEEEDDSFDMDHPPARYARPEQPHAVAAAREDQTQPRTIHHEQQGSQQSQEHRRLVMRQSKAHAEPAEPISKRESSPEGDNMPENAPGYDQPDVFDGPLEQDRSFSNSDRSGSVEPVKRHQPVPHTSPVRRGPTHDRRRSLLTSPPIMSSPPTNVFARMSQPYQPLRTSFNIPSSNLHAEALMSSPPPSSGIMPSDVRMRRLPPPTPRQTSNDGDSHAGSHIFLPAPNIKPGKPVLLKKDGVEQEAKPSLPPIHMMSPASALTLNTQSPVSSVRGSAAQHRSSSPSPKSSSQASSSGYSHTRSPTLNKSKHLHHSSEVFKTPDRFAAPSSRTVSSPSKLAHLAGNNASKALQSLQASTPKLGSRAAHGLMTPGGYYDPYEYGAVLDEELDRMVATNTEDSVNRHGDRRPLPFPSPVDRTPKWQPWSPW